MAEAAAKALGGHQNFKVPEFAINNARSEKINTATEPQTPKQKHQQKARLFS